MGTPNPVPAAPSPSTAQVWAPRIAGAVAGVPVVLGIVKTLMELGTDQSFTVSDAAYYTGWAALGAIGGIWCGAMAGGAVAWVLTEVLGQDEDDNVIFGVVGLVFVVCTIIGVLAAEPPTAGSGAGWRIFGIVTVAAGGIVYAVLMESDKPPS